MLATQRSPSVEGATMTQVPRGTYTHLTDAAGYAQLIERYDNFLFGAWCVRGTDARL